MHKLSTPSISLHPNHCKACWKCIDACPRQVIGKVRFLFHRHAVICNPEACIGCLRCVKACPEGCFSKRQ